MVLCLTLSMIGFYSCLLIKTFETEAVLIVSKTSFSCAFLGKFENFDSPVQGSNPVLGYINFGFHLF